MGGQVPKFVKLLEKFQTPWIQNPNVASELYTDDYHSPEKLGTKPRRCLILLHNPAPTLAGGSQMPRLLRCGYFGQQ